MNSSNRSKSYRPDQPGLVDHAKMREMNLALILSCLREQRRLSRSQLAQITGLTKATVSSLVKELIDRKFVREIGLNNTAIGRPSIELELNPEVGYIIGAEIGVDFVSVILTNFCAEVLWHVCEDTTALQGEQQPVLARTTELICKAADQVEQFGGELLGLGLGVPGLVDVDTGRLLFAPNLGWKDVPLRDILEEQFRFLVHVDNEANLAALGESYFGAGRDSNFVLFVSSGVGLGGGIVYHKEILQGANGLAGEIGHMTMDPDGLPCNCGNAGCWETLAGQGAVFRRTVEMAAGGRGTVLAGDGLERLTIPAVVDAADQGDAVALDALRETGRYLGIGIANLINAFNPELVIFGGILSRAQDYLLPAMLEEVGKRALLWSQKNTRLVIARYGTEACVIGGVASVYHRLLSQPTLKTIMKGLKVKSVFFNQEEQRLRAFWRIVILLVLFFALMFLLQAVLGVAASLIALAAGGLSTSANAVQNFIFNGLVLPVLVSVSTLGAAWISFWAAARWIDHRPIRGYGFHFNRAWWRDFGFGLVLGAVLMLFVFVVERAAGWITITKTFWSDVPGFFIPGMIVIVLMYVCVGIYEEMLFRGYLLLNTGEGFHASGAAPVKALALAWIVSSILFGLAHGINPNTTWVSTVDLMAAGMLLGFGYILTGELAIPIGLHITWNIFEGPVFGFAVSGQGNGAGIFAIQQGGPAVLTGGAFGPEAGLIGLAAIVIGIALIWLWVRWTHGTGRMYGEMVVYNPPQGAGPRV